MAYKHLSDNLAQQRRQRQRNLAAGICPRCTEPLEPGYKLCAYHRAYAADEHRYADKAKLKKWSKTSRDRLREEVFDHYGHACACCGETTKEFLTIDHIEGNGAEHKRQGITGGCVTHRWLKRHGFPPGYRVLCANCNLAMGIYGVCPHGTLPPQHTDHPANPH